MNLRMQTACQILRSLISACVLTGDMQAAMILQHALIRLE